MKRTIRIRRQRAQYFDRRIAKELAPALERIAALEARLLAVEATIGQLPEDATFKVRVVADEKPKPEGKCFNDAPCFTCKNATFWIGSGTDFVRCARNSGSLCLASQSCGDYEPRPKPVPPAEPKGVGLDALKGRIANELIGVHVGYEEALDDLDRFFREAQEASRE